jgi:CelD/BcsL family acetyltransferase involved in cellulose biosynthesis
MGKFSSKHRKNLLREVKKLRDGALGEMRLVRCESPEEVPAFLEKAFEVSRKTYQWTLCQRGLSATELIRMRVHFAAAQGWLRSYLLFCGERACAFVLGFQYKGRFLLHEIGFDPALAKYSVGTVLQLLAVEDLFLYNRPHILDFEAYGKYKEVFSTESYFQGKLFLFRRGAYTRLLRASHRGCEFTNGFLSSLTDHLNLKSKLKRRLRGWSNSQ